MKKNSFTLKVKEELYNTPAIKFCCKKVLLYSQILLGKNKQTIDGGRKIFFSLTNQVNFFLKLAKEFFKDKIKLKRIKNKILIFISKENFSLSKIYGKKKCCKRSFLKGAFLSKGSVNLSSGNYHLEWRISEEKTAFKIKNILEEFKLNPKFIFSKNHYWIYFKKAEEIAVILNILGASVSLLRFEEVRALKETKNQVNRLVNCETANLEKTSCASFRQIQKIKFIKQTIGLSKLPSGLKEIARARLKYPEASFKELGALQHLRLTKASISRRLFYLEELADNINKSQNLKCKNQN